MPVGAKSYNIKNPKPGRASTARRSKLKFNTKNSPKLRATRSRTPSRKYG